VLGRAHHRRLRCLLSQRSGAAWQRRLGRCACRGNPSAKQLFDALIDCWKEYGCDDAECLQLNCATENAACRSYREASGEPDGGAPATGESALPAGLVGEWATSDQSTTYQFKADGSYQYVFYYGSSLSCIAYLSRRITELGTLSVQGDTLTTMGMSRTTQTQNCNFSSSTETDHGTTQSYRYVLSGNTLTLTDSKDVTLTLGAQ